MDITQEEMQRRAEKVLSEITPEEDERVRKLIETPMEITVDTNACDVELIQVLAEESDMTPRELASKLFAKSVQEFATYVANLKLMGMEDQSDIHS